MDARIWKRSRKTPGSRELPLAAGQAVARSAWSLQPPFLADLCQKCNRHFGFFFLSGEVDGVSSREAELPMDPTVPAAGPCAACVQKGRFGP